jgi:hypothetical protein
MCYTRGRAAVPVARESHMQEIPPACGGVQYPMVADKR